MNKDKKTKTQFTSLPDIEFQFQKKTAGKYKIIREIGRGGMGIIYESFQEDLKRKVAIKVLPLNTAHCTATTARFKREAETVARIRHSGVAQVFDFGKDEGCYFIVMEYVEGETLEEKLEKKSIDLPGAVDIVRKVALILDDLHKQSILHRDIKPSNIMIKKDGSIVLLDFGISKCLDDDSLYKLTHEPVGTPAYMPPEFIRSGGCQSDIRSDIYSLGVVLYEAATGKLPFGKPENYYEVIEKILLADYLLPAKENSAVSKPLETIILKCMAGKPADRYLSAKELEKDLESYSRKAPIKASRVVVLTRYMRSYYKKWFTVIFVLLSTGVLLSFSLWAVKKMEKSIPEEISWKQVVFPLEKPFIDRFLIYKDIEGEIKVSIKDQFVSSMPDQRSILWLRNAPGFVLLKDKFPRDIQMTFETHASLQEGEFFGAFINSPGGVGGYILRIEKDSIALCRNYYENIIKKYPLKSSGDINQFLFGRIGAEVLVRHNGKTVIRFIDYHPIIGEESGNLGFYFTKGFREIKNIEILEPRQPLAVSPLIVGQRFYELGQNENAIKEYKKIIQEYRGAEIALIAQFKEGVCYKELGQFDKALAAFDAIIRTSRKSDILAKTYFQKGTCLFLMGNEDWAEDIFTKIQKEFQDADSDLNMFMFLYDRINEKIGKDFNLREAADIDKRFQYIIENFPSRRALLTVSTRVLIERMAAKGFLDKALSYIDLLEKYFPFQTLTLAWGYIKKGDITMQMGDIEGAAEIYKQTYEKFQGYRIYEVIALDKLADLYVHQKKLEEAEAVFKKIMTEYKNQTEFSHKAKVKLKLIEDLRR